MAFGTLVSRRAMLRGSLLMTAGLVGGCAGLGTAGPAFDASRLSQVPTLLVATNRRAIEGAQAAPWYGAERASRVNIARAALVPPPEGRFSLSAVGLGDWKVDRIDPLPHVASYFESTNGARDVLVYVHGYNTAFDTALIDSIRLSDGIRFQGATMLFSWPSRAKLLDYGYDRESAMWSRDALEQVLDQVLATPSVGRVHLVAHSIGTMVSMEALRQLYSRRGEDGIAKLGAVVFASPDIDMDVFASSVERVGSLAKRVTVVTSTRDRALAVSRWIAGGITRVGAAEKTRLVQLGLEVVDASEQGWGIVNHDLFLSNSHVRGIVRRAIEQQGTPLARAHGGT